MPVVDLGDRDANARGLLLYDAECGFCTRAAHWVRRQLPVDVDVLALQSVDLAALGVDPGRAEREIPFVPAGRAAPSYGHEACADLLATATSSRLLRLLGVVLRAPVIASVTRVAYRWVAAQRQSLPGGTAQCALPPSA